MTESEAHDIPAMLAAAEYRLFGMADDINRNDTRPEHDIIAARVFQRMQMRHAQLHYLVELTTGHVVNAAFDEIWLKNRRADSPATPPKVGEIVPPSRRRKEGETMDGRDMLHPAVRSYHLAVTDLFVEKAISFLEGEAKYYKERGTKMYTWAFRVVAAGTTVALVNMVVQNIIERLFGTTLGNDPWPVVTSNFTRSFTAYGMIVLTAVALWRYGKAMLDQSERLSERRHALRQGRLFVHLNDGKLSITEKEKAFTWNMSQANAFGNLRTDAQAPWGTVLNELAKASPELAKTMAEQFRSGFDSATKGGGKTERAE